MLFDSPVNADNAVERDALLRQQPDTLMGTTGSGDRILALLDAPSLRQVIALDPNQEAQHVFALKLEALKALSIPNYLAFIGHTYMHPLQRRDILSLLWPYMTGEARNYWLWKTSAVERGIMNAGYVNRYLTRLQLLLSLFSGSRSNFSYRTRLLFSDRVPDPINNQLPVSLQTGHLERVQHRLRQGDLTIQFANVDICTYLQQNRMPTKSIFLSLSILPGFLPATELIDTLKEIKKQQADTSVQGILRSFQYTGLGPDDLDRFSQFATVRDVSHQEQTQMDCVYHFAL